MTENKNDGARKSPSFAELVRKFALASVGAVVIAQEELEEFVNKLVQKGELAEKDGRTLVKDLLETRRQKLEADANKVATAAVEKTNGVAANVASNVTASLAGVTGAIDSTVDKVLQKINVPTKGDIDELAKKIEDINKKIEALAGRRS